VAFPARLGKRQLLIKPSVAWINYGLEAEGLVVDAICNPPNRCLVLGNSLRETTLTASGSQRFNGIGPGLDIEVNTGRYGPLGVSLFMGARAYAIVGDRSFSFETEETFDDPIGMDRAVGRFEVEVAPWMFRGHVGIRFSLLGNEE